MSDDISDRERDLAEKIDRLKDEADRPQIEGGGWIGDAMTFVAANTAIWIIRASLLVFVGYEAYFFYAKAQQQVSALTEKRAQALSVEIEAQGVRAKIGADSAELARLKAELSKLQSEAAVADADAKAQGQKIGDATARLASIRAEIETARAEAAGLQAQVDAQSQMVAGLPLIVSKKRNEVEAAETATEQEVWAQHLVIAGMRQGDWRTYFMGPLIGRNPQDDGIRRYSMIAMFNELHGQTR